MNEILDLLKEALNKMLLKRQEAAGLSAECQALKARCEKELDEIRAKMVELDQKASELRTRESKIRQIESVDKERQALGVIAGDLQKRAKVLDADVSECASLKASLADRAKSLEARELALSREKEAYKEQLKKEFFADVASGKVKKP